MAAPTDPGFWSHSTDIAQIVSAIVAACGLVVAGLAAWLLASQTKSNARVARENLSLETHREYLKLCIERPELTSSEAMLTHLKRKSFRGILEEDVTPETERALWFLSYVLDTVEQLIVTSAGDPIWEAVGYSQLSYHESLLVEVWPVWNAHYGRPMRELVEKRILRLPGAK